MSEARCGTTSGYRRHLRLREPVCPLCAQAWRDYSARWRKDHPPPVVAPRHRLRCAICDQSLRDHEIGGPCYLEYLISGTRPWKGRLR